MKITVQKYIENDVFKVQVLATDYSQIEMQRMASFSEPQINLGGDFAGPPAFTLPTNYARIRADSPFFGAFDTRDYPVPSPEPTPTPAPYSEAEAVADVWAAAIVTRLKVAIAALRTELDDYTGESVETY